MLCKCKAHPSVSSFQSERNAYLRYSSVLKRNKINSMESEENTDPTHLRDELERQIRIFTVEYVNPFITLYTLLSNTEFLS